MPVPSAENRPHLQTQTPRRLPHAARDAQHPHNPDQRGLTGDTHTGLITAVNLSRSRVWFSVGTMPEARHWLRPLPDPRPEFGNRSPRRIRGKASPGWSSTGGRHLADRMRAPNLTHATDVLQAFRSAMRTHGRARAGCPGRSELAARLPLAGRAAHRHARAINHRSDSY